MLLPPHKTCSVYLEQTWQTRLVGRLAQRHQGGGRRPGDSRSAECHAGLVRDTAPLHPHRYTHPAATPHYTTRQIAAKLGLSGARTAGGQRSPAQSSCTAAPCPKQTWQTRLVGRLAQRHQGGGRRPGDSRSAECHAGLVRDTVPLHHPAAPCPKQTWQTSLGAARRRAYLARARRASLMPSLTPTSWGSALSAAAASRSL